MRIRRVTSSAPPLTMMMRVVKSLLKSASSTSKFVSILDRMSMKLEGKLGGFGGLKTKLLQGFQSVRGVDGPAHTQKNGMKSDVSALKVLAKLAVLLLGGLKLAPRPGVFTVLDFHKVDVPLIRIELAGFADSGRQLVG